ncbi:tetratricopeptide repeat protein [Streptomyces sp. NPDC002851]
MKSVVKNEPGPAPTGRGRRAPSLKRVLLGTVAGSVVLVGALTLVPLLQDETERPALGPSGRALAAAQAGAPAALPDLDALIRERAAHVARHPGDEESWAVLGSAYVERGERTADYRYYPKAERALRTSLKVRAGERGNVEALTGMAALARVRHDYRAARKWGELARKQAPKRWTLYPDLIDTYVRLGDQKAAGKALEKLQELRSGQAVLARAGQVYQSRGWREDAAAALSDAAALAETPAERAAYQHLLGQQAWERGEPAEALRWFDAARRADPGHHASLAGRARAQAALGRGDEAVLTYQAVLVKRPLPQYHLELGELYAAQGDEPAARVQYDLLRRRIAEQERGGGVRDELVLGLFEAGHGDADAAVERLTAEWQRHPSPQTADALGWALHRAGDDEEAFGYAQKAMKEGPRSALFAYHRGEIERSLEKYGAARRHLQEALRINPHFSPLLAPKAREALTALGEPPEGGPAQMEAEPSKSPESEQSEQPEEQESQQPTREAAPTSRPSSARPTTPAPPAPTPTPTRQSWRTPTPQATQTSGSAT